ncbi:hypothetical protein [Acrocarpospora macrocephala]|uniref:hypothetical protein n=1 Tax=Acrocarpospora macrocephala TaxID=150177 RepID=UPI0012D30558|nr:hypothetical protein [Acrocarpospora macrocephala]
MPPPAAADDLAGQFRATGHRSAGNRVRLASTAGIVHQFWNDSRTGRLEIFTERIPARSGPTTPTSPTPSVVRG